MNHFTSSCFLVSLGFVLGITVTFLYRDPGFFKYKGNFYSRHSEHDAFKRADETPPETADLTERDQRVHKDDDVEARQLFEKIRVFCWVMTSEKNLYTRAVYVNATWAKRCNKVMFMSDKNNTKFPAFAVKAPPGYHHLTARTMNVFQYLYDNHQEDADWFLKADDDTYVILENLRYMLSNYSSEIKVFFGHVFQAHTKQGYTSGGGGYVISKAALKAFGSRKHKLCAEDYGSEDVQFGKCMYKLHVKLEDSRDILGRSRFHCFPPQSFIHGRYPDWYLEYDKYGAKAGAAHMSDYPISFHYITPTDMYNMEYYVYHMRPYGIYSKPQKLNR